MHVHDPYIFDLLALVAVCLIIGLCAIACALAPPNHERRYQNECREESEEEEEKPEPINFDGLL